MWWWLLFVCCKLLLLMLQVCLQAGALHFLQLWDLQVQLLRGLLLSLFSFLLLSLPLRDSPFSLPAAVVSHSCELQVAQIVIARVAIFMIAVQAVVCDQFQLHRVCEQLAPEGLLSTRSSLAGQSELPPRITDTSQQLSSHHSIPFRSQSFSLFLHSLNCFPLFIS